MAVLALGPADASTDNLRLALKQLGYKITPTRPDVTASLLARKLACRLPGQLFAPQLPGTPDELRGLFEPVLHRSTAFLGQEAAVLGPELVRAYPEAKVVLNRPRARGGWALVTDDLERAKRWGPWTWELLSCRAFWRGQVARMLYLAHFYGDNEANRTRWYDQHFRHMEVALRGKQYLEWDEAEGWYVSVPAICHVWPAPDHADVFWLPREPLCAFLGLEVPDQPFPAAKRVTPAEARRAWFQKWARYARRTTSTLAISLGIFVAGICVGVKLVLD